jgi:hypothetical protein
LLFRVAEAGVAASRPGVDLAGDVALEAAQEFGLALAFGGAAGHVVPAVTCLGICWDWPGDTEVVMNR